MLNQPYGAFEWLDLPENANPNWHNAHNFYGDLRASAGRDPRRCGEFFETYYAPNNAVLVVVGDMTRTK